MDACPTQTPEESVNSHIGLVKRIANGLQVGKPSSVEFDDLVQVGLIGLMEAIGRYQPMRGVTFITFASARIRGAMADELRSRDYLTRATRRFRRDREMVIERFKQRHLCAPSEADVAREMEMTYPAYLRQLARGSYLEISQGVGAFTAVAEEDEDEEQILLTSEPTECAGDPSDWVQLRQRYEGLVDAIESLKPRDRVVLEKYYFEDMNLREIGQELGVTESRVSQILSQTTARLRSMVAN